MLVKKFSITANFVDVWKKQIYPATIEVVDNKIKSIQAFSKKNSGEQLPYILPGFVDSHIHIESSMLAPSEFARVAVLYGTVATVSDPHEIANVCGLEGVEFMIDNGKKTNFKFNFGAPSCVPATTFETAGDILSSNDVEKLLQKDEIKYLSEMMNFPGVLSNDPEVMKKIAIAQKLNKPIDGHAPGLRGEQAKQYIDAGISTDHECFTKEEALDKLKYGMHILIREGSAAKNFEALIDLLNDYPEKIMFCSDDKHPDSLIKGHINQLCARAAAKGIDVFKILQAACVNPVKHYKLDVGLLREGDLADFILVKDLEQFEVEQTYINGQLVAYKDNVGHGSRISLLPSVPIEPINNFNCEKIFLNDLTVYTNDPSIKNNTLSVIEALDGQLITNKLTISLDKLNIINHTVCSNIEHDILKIVVVNRYQKAPIAKAFIKNFGLKTGAIASSVAHDSHNIVAVGVNDNYLMEAINTIIEVKGGISCVSGTYKQSLSLPIAGLMSNIDAWTLAKKYIYIDNDVKKKLGSTLSSPFMTLSFMALLVIPHLKLSDRGLFDGDTFTFISDDMILNKL